MLLASVGKGRVEYTYTFSGNAQQAGINTSIVPGYVAGKTDLTIVVNSGVYVWSDTVNVPALTINAFAAGDTITLINNGYIIGRGADGVDGFLRQAGNNGGPALEINYPVTINNTNSSAYIAGGGGSGGSYRNVGQAGSGGGAGGGKGGDANSNGNIGAGGAGGAIGQPGGNGGNYYYGYYVGGGGGGRVLPGVGGVALIYNNTMAPMVGMGGGAGGSGSISTYGIDQGTPRITLGGAGGGWGAAGAYQGYRNSFPASAAGSSGGNGGSANNNGNAPYCPLGVTFGQPGGNGGKAINLNGNSVTWVSGDIARVYGAVS